LEAANILALKRGLDLPSSSSEKRSDGIKARARGPSSSLCWVESCYQLCVANRKPPIVP
jgi:hypothetical protein